MRHGQNSINRGTHLQHKPETRVVPMGVAEHLKGKGNSHTGILISEDHLGMSLRERFCRDVSSSLLVMLYLQTWQAMFVVVITMSSVAFFTYVGSGGAEASLSWTLVSFVVLLPQTLLLLLVSSKS